MLCGTVAASSINQSKNIASFDVLDQSQTVCDDTAFWVGRFYTANRQAAQSFIPQKGILTRVDIYLGRYWDFPASEPFYLAIRETLTGVTLTETSINSGSVPMYDFAWITFDLPDIPVNAGETYFLVGHSNEIPNHGMYIWGGADSNPYPNGMAYELWEEDPNWIKYANIDLCFKTYGIDNDPPDTPGITGTQNGQIGVLYDYTFIAVEPDGENIKYVIDWADGNQEETTYVSSGESVTVSHAWENQGLYTIKAKAVDIIGKESDWGKLTVTMPRDKAVSNSMLLPWLLERFPLLQKLSIFLTI